MVDLSTHNEDINIDSRCVTSSLKDRPVLSTSLRPVGMIPFHRAILLKKSNHNRSIGSDLDIPMMSRLILLHFREIKAYLGGDTNSYWRYRAKFNGPIHHVCQDHLGLDVRRP